MIDNTVTLTSKLPNIGQSIFSKMTALAIEYNAINLAQGFPNFHPTKSLIDLVSKYMNEGMNQYAPMPGIPKLREQIAMKTQSLYGKAVDMDTEITVTAGATQGIYLIINSVVHQRDEVIIFEPAYDSYIPSILLAGGTPRPIALNPTDYSINFEELKNTISDKTRLIIINSPHNPSGAVLSASDIHQLYKLVKDTDIMLLSDEVYEHIIFDVITHESILKYPELAERSFVVSSFGKTYHTTGWKMGYVIAPKQMTDELRKVYSYAMFSASTPMQYAYADILAQEPNQYHTLSAYYQSKRDLFLEAMRNSRFNPIACKGAYFQCMDYSEISNEADIELAIRITKEYGVASIPTSPFYHDRQDNKVLRFCFAKTDDVLLKAAERLCKI